MTTTDMGITYDAKLKEVKATIAKLEKMSIDMTDIKKTIERIENNLSEKIQKSYDSFGQASPVAFLHDSLTEDYGRAIKELDMLNEALKKEWGTYYQIEQTYQRITEAITKVDKTNIKMIALSTKELLHSIKTSTTIDYKLEKDLVNKIYKLVYKVMQLEFIYSNESLLLDTVKESEIDSQFIVEFIKKDLNNVKEDKEQIEQLVLQLKQKGLDEKHLLDKQLLVLLILYKNPDIELRNKEHFIELVDEYLSIKSQKAQKETEIKDNEEEITELLADHKETTKKRNGRRIVVLLNTILISAGILAGLAVGRELAKQKSYLTTTSIYDSSTDEQTRTQDYLPGKYGSTQLIEYAPWDSPGAFRTNYRRNVYKYVRGTDLDGETLRKYLEEDHAGELNYDHYEEISEEKPEDFGYVGNKYVITEVTKDLEDYTKEDRPGLWATLSFFIIGGLITTDLLLFSKLSKESLTLIRHRRKELSQEIKEKRMDQEEAVTELKNLAFQEQERIAQIRQSYNALSYASQQSPDVEKAKRKIL